MKLKFLLLSTGVALATVPAAAADLTLAEPVDYVKVCDNFGVGFWSIPGTDTCLKIAGYVRFDTRYRDDPITITGHSSNWDFRTRARLNITANSITEFGTLTGFVRLQGNYDPSSSTNGQVLLDQAYLSLGGLLAGYTTSAFDYPSAGYNLDLLPLRSDMYTQHIQYTFKEGKTGLIFSLEDPRVRWGNGVNNGKWPDVIAALTYADGPFDAKLSGAVVDQWQGNPGYAVQIAGSLKLDQIAKGDAVRFMAGYAKDAGSFTGASPGIAAAGLGANFAGGTSWNVVGSAQHFWTPKFSTAVMASYVSAVDATNVSAYSYNAAISAAWVPVKEFTVGAELGYTYRSNNAANPDTIIGLLRFIREFQ